MRLEVLSRDPAPTAPARSAPLLFVHGAWHGAWCWEDHFLDHFARAGYATHALSLRGHGASERPRHFKTMRLAGYVADVAAVAQRLPTPPILIAHSMGGLVAQKYLEDHPAPAAILLASVPPAGVLRTTLSIAGRHPLRFLRVNATWSLLPLVNTPALTREHFFTRATDDTIVRAAYARIQDEAYWAFLDMLAFALPRRARIRRTLAASSRTAPSRGASGDGAPAPVMAKGDSAPRNPAPLLVLGGARDTIFTPREARSLARAYRGTVEIFPDMGHDLMLDTAWQQVADRMLAWLDTQLAP